MKAKKDENIYYYTNRHAVYLLQYHLVVVTKYRHKVINNELKDRLIEISYSIIENDWESKIISINTDEDHVHILFRAHPKSEISKFINAYKSASSRLIKKEFPSIRKKLWKEYFWSQSFCLLTTGGAPINILKKYIESQGIKNGKKS